MNNTMNKRYIIILIVLFILVSVFHFVTLTISPIVWGDEIFMNSVALDFVKNKTFFLSEDPAFSRGMEVLAYGPIFFVLDALIINEFGNGIFQARFLQLFFGLMLIASIAIFLYKRIEDKKIWLLLVMAFLFDPFFNAGLNRGRMDNVASFFYFISFILAIPEKQYSKESWSSYLFSGVFFLATILTTARFNLLGLPFLAIAIYQFLISKNKVKTFLHWSLWGFIIVSLYISWIFIKFKSIDNYIDHYLEVLKRVPGFLGFHFFVPVESILLVVVAVLSLIFSSINKSYDFKSQTNIFILSVITVFYLFIGDTGPYSIIIIPYIYLLIGIIANSKKWKERRNLPVYGILLLIVFNISIFSLKGATLLFEYPSRNYKKVESFIKKNIPENSCVVADEIYYYAVLSSGSEFLNLCSFNRNTAEVEKVYREKYKYDYLIVSERIKKVRGYDIPFYTDKSEFIKVGELKMPHSGLIEWLSTANIFKSLGTFGNYSFSSTGYDGVIYKRVKPQQDSSKTLLQNN